LHGVQGPGSCAAGFDAGGVGAIGNTLFFFARPLSIAILNISYLRV
jgi:hypothetical protein